jgi:hypothetical protein
MLKGRKLNIERACEITFVSSSHLIIEFRTISFVFIARQNSIEIIGLQVCDFSLMNQTWFMFDLLQNLSFAI